MSADPRLAAPAHVRSLERALNALPPERLRAISEALATAAWHLDRGRPALALDAVGTAATILLDQP